QERQLHSQISRHSIRKLIHWILTTTYRIHLGSMLQDVCLKATQLISCLTRPTALSAASWQGTLRVSRIACCTAWLFENQIPVKLTYV
ncbi:hypothetical protein LEMLEM_LOCUS18864, partial [Lemmus lemmus]